MNPALRAAGWALLLLAAGVASAAPPQSNLRVEMRAMSAAATAAAPAAPGDRVVDSRRGTVPAAGDFSVGSGRSALGGDGAVMGQVIVLNGAQASLRVSQRVALPTSEWVWGGRDAGVAQSRIWLDVNRGFRVQPSWPGGTRPVMLEIRTETADGTTVQTRLTVPLNEWVAFAASAEQALQMRVSVQR